MQVINKFLKQMPTLTIKGNNSVSTANPSDLTVAQVNAILPVFTSGLNGLVPASGGGTTNFLRADGTFAVPPSGTGTVTSVALSVPSFLSVSGSPVTSSGTLAVSYSGTALPTANGGTGLTSPGTSGNALVSNGTTWTSAAVGPGVTGNYSNGFFSSAYAWGVVNGSASVGDFTVNATGTFNIRNSNGITVTSASGNLPGITFTPAAIGSVYLVILKSYAISTNTSGMIMTDGTTSWDQGMLWTNGNYSPFTSQTIYVSTSTSPVTLKLQASGTLNLGNGEAFNSSLDFSIVQLV